MPDFGTDDGGTEELLSSMWASLIGSQVAVWAVVSVSVLFFCAFCVPKALASGHAVQLPVYKCPYPDSPDPEQYERFLTGLNGTKIVFIGDSITRFQYITFASYIAEGVCPRTGGQESASRQEQYKDLYHPRGAWNEYYRDSSKALNTATTTETCFCEEGKVRVPESRIFGYKDQQTNLHPTHVILNYGHWMTGSSRDCGFKAPFSHCPYLPDVCEFLTGTHPFKVFWQTTSPRLDVGDTITDHHLHIPHACNLDQSMVLHRGLAFRGLEPDTEKQQWLFHDKLHLAPPAYHAFNGLLLDMVTKGTSHR